MYVQTRVYVHICIYVYMLLPMYKHIYVHIYIYLWIAEYVHVHVYWTMHSFDVLCCYKLAASLAILGGMLLRAMQGL